MKNNLDIEKLKYPLGKCPKIDNVSKNDLETWIATIETFPSKIKALTSTLTVQKLNWIYRPKGWNIKQVVHHCADSHINSFIRFKLALTEDVPTIKPYEEALWAERPTVIRMIFHHHFKSLKACTLVGFC